MAGAVEEAPPLLVHFGINKTIIPFDSAQQKSAEDGVREGVSELLWGHVRKSATGELTWEWDGGRPCSDKPHVDKLEDGVQLMSYGQFCKKKIKDKEAKKQATRNYTSVSPPKAHEEINKLLHTALERLQLPQELQSSPGMVEMGVKGAHYAIIPALFHFVANLQLAKRTFGLIFRSFGTDHDQVVSEWNAFCDMKHPIFSHLLKDCGAMNGTVSGVPDRRIHNLHTFYRDAKGPILMLDTITNGPKENSWDAWVKQKPKPQVDTRNGREYIAKVVKCVTIEGYAPLQSWLKKHLMAQKSCAIKDDWAWWTWNSESHNAGKLLISLDAKEKEETRQIFYDDNVEHDSTRIVDCRTMDGKPVPQESALAKVCDKINIVEALSNNNYFLERLGRHYFERMDAKASFLEFESQVVNLKKGKTDIERQLEALRKEMQGMVEENMRLKLLNKIKINDEEHLEEVLTKAGIAEKFGEEGLKTIADLWKELEQGACWLEYDKNGELVRVIEMCFLKIKFKDRVLVESHEQSADKIQSRNYLAGARKTLLDKTFKEAVDRFFESGLQVDIRSAVTIDSQPVFIPDAPEQITTATLAFPIKCKMQQSEAVYTIREQDIEGIQEISNMGLPNAKHFTTVETQEERSITHFWRWDKIASFEAMSSQRGKKGAGPIIDISLVCDKLFRGHPRRDAYENLILQMFETFTAKKLAGGFSGSLVIRVQPYESNGKMGDPCIVKMDAGEAIREEYINSVAVFEALPDRAARILGDAVYANSKDGEEFGAMRLELAGACWNVPELAQGGGTLLCTFKDLLVYESEQTMLGKNDTTDGVGRPFGNTNSILAESFGPGGIVACLRNGGAGLNRHKETCLLWGWYTLKGKVSKYNPFNATPEEYPPAPAMKRMYKQYFGEDMPDLKTTVVDTIKPMLIDMATNAPKELFPLVGLAHGDLNAANIMIDAMDAVWLIDFATSVELPLFTDMCKFEMASLFEYAAIPITPSLLVELAGPNKKLWDKINVGDWLRVDYDVAEILLTQLVDMGTERVASLNEASLYSIIDGVAAKTRPTRQDKQIGISRALKARLVASEALMDSAFNYMSLCSPALISGDFLTDALYMEVPQPQQSHGVAGCASLRFFMDVASSVRRLMAQDIMSLLQSQGSDLNLVDGTCLQLWLPFLRESYRILGYRDISPQAKIWSMYHCKVVSELVLKTLGTLKQSWANLNSLPLMSVMREEISKIDEAKGQTDEDKSNQESVFSEVQSLWFFTNRHLFPQTPYLASVVRKVHERDPQFKEKPGLFSPILEVHYQEASQFLSFDDTLSADTKSPQDWSLYLKDDEERMDEKLLIGSVTPWVEGTHVSLPPTGPRSRLSSILPPLDLLGQSSAPPDIDRQVSTESDSFSASPSPPASEDFAGTPPVPDIWGYTHKITLRSRLFRLSSDLVSKSQEDLMIGVPLARSNFSMAVWSGDLIADSTRKEEKRERRGRRISMNPKAPADLQQYLHLDCVCISPDGKERFDMKLVLGTPVCCYPLGSAICCEQSFMPPGMPWFPEMVIWSLHDTGLYKLRDATNPEKEIDHDFDPQPVNHIYCDPARYQVGNKVVWVKDQMSFLDGTILEEPNLENGWRYSIQFSVLKDPNTGDGRSERATTTCLKHLNPRNSALMDVPSDSFEDEWLKVRSNAKARHSFLIDALSGMRLEVKECAMPTLSLTSPNLPPPLQVTDTTPFQPPKAGTSRHRIISFIGKPEGVQDDADVEQKTPDRKAGWQNIMAAMDRYDRREPCCGPYAFLVVGLPGSGKTSLIARAFVDCLEKQRNFLPVLIPVADLLKKIAQAGDSFDMNTSKPGVFFDMYLRTVFGEDSQRYKTIIQAKLMHRVMFLFQGLDGAGAVGPFIEKMILELILDRHLILITSRPFLEGAFSLPSMHSYVSAMQLEKFNDEQKHWVAQVRLGAEGLKAYETFVKQLKESHMPSEDDGAQAEEQEDVFGNPMMLSMLLIYLLVRQKKKEEAIREGKHTEGDDSITQSAVYRVAIDVMLAQAQSKSQADRHNKEEKMEQAKRVLERIAMEMQRLHTQELDADEVSKFIPANLHDTWKTLRHAVAAGHAMFLRMPTGNNLRFFVKGFQNYFSACQIIQEPGIKLPALEPLLTESWWAEMLEMLADTDSHTFVAFIEKAIKSYKPQKGWSFLHLAASVGHRPIFQHFQFFEESTRQALKSKSENLFTPLHVAAEKGNVQICKLMIDHKAMMDCEDRYGCLPMHVAMKNGHFTTGKYLLDQWIGQYGSARRDITSKNAEGIAQRILKKTISEEEFIEACKAEFVELGFYVKQFAADGKKSLAALLATYWVCGDHYDKFVRSQENENIRLSPTSWTKLQAWANEDVQLTRSAELIGAMLQFLSIINVGKIVPFRKIFAPGYDDAAESLAHVLRHYPILMPSFSRLSDDMQQMIQFSTRADFNFGQFLQAENLPANLGTVKVILSEASGKNNVFGFFLFRIFAAMCGLRGDKTLEGSLMMIDPLFLNFKLGLDVLNHLADESAQDVSARFLGKKAEVLQISFNPSDPQSKAFVRLCILCRVLKSDGVAQIEEAWRQMDPETLAGLVKHLNTDGIGQQPGFLLFGSPQFMDMAKSNPSIGPARAFQMLLRIYEAAAAEYADSKKQVVTVFVNEMADWAKNTKDGSVFDFTKFDVARTNGPKSEVLASVAISPWKLVNDQEELAARQEQLEGLVHKLQAGSMKEAAFIRRFEECFPELAYYQFSGEDTATLLQTKCALLSIYWIYSDQAEAFTRGHHPDEKLRDDTWASLRDPLMEFLDQEEIFEALLVALAIRNLGKITKFQQQLAPGVEGYREVLAHVIDNCPKVLPSYACIQEPYNTLVRSTLTASFNFVHFLNAEGVAYSLKDRSSLMSSSQSTFTSVQEMIPWFFVVLNFTEIAGSMGDQSLDGSLYMTELRFRSFKICTDALQDIDSSMTEDDSVITSKYTDFLGARAQNLGIPFHKLDSQTHCVARLACLCKCLKPDAGKRVLDTFSKLTLDEQKGLTKYMTADGFIQKPAFVLADCPAFLEAAMTSSEVGLLPALRTLLRICERAAFEVGSISGKPTIEVYFKRLTKFTQEFLGSVAFDAVPFELKEHKMGVIISPKAWIPVNNQAVLETLSGKAIELCSGLLENKVTEEEFKTIAGRIYPEISYFPSQLSGLRGETHGAMLSIFWLIRGDYDGFTRQQPEEEQISRDSWAWIQEWIENNVKLTTPEAVDAIMAFMAIHALGKIQELREELAPEYTEACQHDVALARILRKSPEVVPSFLRLSRGYRDLIVDSLRVDFQFNQFVQAENVPANLVMVKEVLEPHGEDGFEFFCLRVFATLCGSLGYKSLEGSLYMTEWQFQRFRPGLEALQKLRKMDASAAWQTFLLQRASKTLVRFASNDHHAIARLLCLCSSFDSDAGDKLVKAFNSLSPGEKIALTACLCPDGMGATPGYVLNEFSILIQQAQTNHSVGVVAALQMLAKIQIVCDMVVRQTPQVHNKVMLQMADVVDWLRECGQDGAEFIRASVHATPVRVNAHGKENPGLVLKIEIIKPGAATCPLTNGVANGVKAGTPASPAHSGQVSPTTKNGFKPTARTRRLTNLVRAERKKIAAGYKIPPGTITSL